MQRDFSLTITGWLFISGAFMMWAGLLLLPHHLRTFFEPGDFSAIKAHLHLWLWLYRVHLFGLITTVMALVALATTVESRDARVLVWPGSLVVAAGLIVGALAAAFYYHHGVWGATELSANAGAAVEDFIQALRVDTEYVTCLVRFSRVFAGLGLVVLAVGLAKAQALPRWLLGAAALIGIGAMGLTMGAPDRLSWFQPLFHAEALWFAATGFLLLRSA